MYLPNLDEVSFRIVLAFPNASEENRSTTDFQGCYNELETMKEPFPILHIYTNERHTNYSVEEAT
jgi:hypothetical protein